MIDNDRWLAELPEVRELLGPGYAQVVEFGRLLGAEGELRGLIGPDEPARLWNRHLLNSAALAEFLPSSRAVELGETPGETISVADLGSGAGLPGIVLAAMRPDLQFTLIEPMERRTDWLNEVVEKLSLNNVKVLRARAEEVPSDLRFDAVTARAVAPVRKLVPLALPLLKPGGSLIALQGKNVAAEIEKADKLLKKLPVTPPLIAESQPVPQADPTTVFTLIKKTV
jgi:16S rRNA (guanine527-N7)-methyltransferase